MKRAHVKASLLALCAGVSFLASYGFQNDAGAQAAAFSPVSGWTVKPAPFSSAGAQSCTAMTRFDNGFSMQMTGSAAGINNLSIDVRQPAFQSGGIMDLTLTVPGVTSSDLQGQAYGNNLLVIDMQGQKNLLAAMRAKNAVNLKLAGNDLTFNLDGLNAAAAQFDQCVGGSQIFGSQPVVTEKPAAPPPVVESVPLAAAQTPAPAKTEPPQSYPHRQRPDIPVVQNAPQGVSMPPEPAPEEEQVATAEPAPLQAPPPAAPVLPKPVRQPESNLVAHKTPELPKPRAAQQLSAQDMERMEKKSLRGESLDDFEPAPITEIAPPPPPLEIETLAEPDEKLTPGPEKPAPAPAITPKRLSDQLAVMNTAHEAPVSKTPSAPEPKKPEVAAASAAAPAAKGPPKGPSISLDKISRAPGTQESVSAQAPASSDETPFANPKANPPQAGRYQRVTAELDAKKAALKAPADSEIKTAYAAPGKPVEITENLDATPEEHAADQAAWNSIPDAEPKAQTETPKPAPAPAPVPIAKAPQAEKISPPPENKPEPRITVRPDGVKEIRSPEPTVTRNVRRVEVDLTKDGMLPDMDEGQNTGMSRSAPSDEQIAAERRVADLEQTIVKLRAENATLDEDLKAALSESRQETASVSSENWNLEKAAMRYNEAEKEIQRLGRQIQIERAQAAEEKKQLESMLFDPAVTNQEQIAKLAELEEQLDSAKAELANQRRTYEQRIQAMQEQLNKR